ncbi:efflux RND transporter permease subunit [Cellulomonas bogoriensis]|uniref:SSD domain-containing protein n=1 Tax=Cellulomonas bogoriensis 69B4 = DSM 16987 TaxID=1386082 RepID=A0A0A0BMZ5_9CELL|nr:MMPL family transporter [Cellulomonas bogoriensis]KGM09255.1 hypothetical protein N869_07500 [Cellulomonas bogoriensis 69B4 = DSM 16987]
MQRLIDAAGRGVERRPGWVLVVLLAVTIALGAVSTQVEMETDIAEFGGDTGLAAVSQEVQDRFGAGSGALQVIVDGGLGGDVLSPEGLTAAQQVTDVVEAELEPWLAADDAAAPAVVSFADVLLEQVEGLDLAPGDLTEPFVTALVQATMDQAGEQVQALLSADLDVDRGQARAGLVNVQLDPGLDPGERTEAGTTLRDALDAEDLGWFTADPFSMELLDQELEDQMTDELPILLAVSTLLIVGVLVALFRRFADVALTLVGLAVVLVWFTGLSVLLGPGFLGWTGPFSQIAIAVPVMLVGLAVDYSVHLVSRYREERAGGQAPAPASGRAIRTVGVALLLVTITTMVGFLSNVQSPLPPIADFGVFTAAGMFAAFVVMGLLIPAARQLLDRRGDRDPDPVPGGGGDSRLGRAVGRVADVAIRFPWTVIGTATAVAVVGTLAATDVDTEFSQEDFVPEDTRAADILDRMEDVFGGNVAEQTFVLVEGDMTDVTLGQALADLRTDLADVQDVRTADGTADATSPVSLVAEIVDSADLLRTQLVEQARVAVGQTPPDQALPLPEELEAEDLPDVDAGLGTDPGAPDGPVGQIDEDELRDRLPPGTELQDALLQLLGPEELADLVAEQAAEQARAEQLDAIGTDTAEALAALDPRDVDLQTLEDIGYPLDDLPADTRDLLAATDDVQALGWVDGDLADDADLDALYDAIATVAGDELGTVLAEDRTSGLVLISTEAGEEGAQPLREELLQALGPVQEVAEDVVVVSEQLVIQETLDLLVDAQVEKILFSLGAALALLVLFYLVTQRRPLLGVITMVPTLFAVPLVLGFMWVMGLPFNALTATVASIAVGFGVDYGIHLSNRFREERERTEDAETAARETVVHTGAALAGSAVTTALAFGVLVFSGLLPLRQFGVITAVTMVTALVATLLVQTSCLVVWERHHRRRQAGR